MKSASRKPQPKRKYFKSRGFSRLFCFSWEQRKFEDLYSYASEGGTPDTNNSSFYKDGTIPFVKIEDTENKYIDSTKSHISVEGLNHSSAWLIPAHNILFTNGATVGNVAINRIPVATKQGILGIIPSKQVTVELMFYLLSSTLFQREVKSRMATGTFATIILKNLNQIPVCIPTNKNEQNLITDYLSQLDNLITLHQRDSIMRFFGAWDNANAWEQRKLGEMGQTYTGLSGKTKDDFGHGQARFVTYMNVFSNPISNPEMTEPIEIDPKQNEVEVGDVFFTTSSETPEEVGMSSVLLEKRGKTYLNSFCFGFRPSEKIDSYYLAYMLRSESARAKITLLAQGISRYNISKNKVMEIAVSLPSLDEQKMIGQYFCQLDNLITLHQRERKNRLFGGKNVKQYNFSRLVLQLLRAMDSRLQRRGSSQGDYG